jgi:hypothetical protein
MHYILQSALLSWALTAFLAGIRAAGACMADDAPQTCPSMCIAYGQAATYQKVALAPAPTTLCHVD